MARRVGAFGAALALAILAGCVAVARAAEHELRAGPKTTHFGGWSAAHPHVLEVDSGDVVRMWTVSGEPGGVPLDAWDVPSELRAVWREACGAEDGTQPHRSPPLPHCGNPGPHIMTGPVKVRGAKPGDVLRVEVLSATPWVPWGWNAIREGKGALGVSRAYGFDAHKGGTYVVPIDLETMTSTLPWPAGGAVDARSPFFGQMGVAPAPDKGVVSSVAPGAHGGNLDDKLLGAGSVLFFKVNVEGALFSAGDGHAAQGDGEFCVTALETSLEGKFRLTVMRGDDEIPKKTKSASDLSSSDDDDALARAVFANMTNPRAETETHFVSMAFHENLDVAAELALVDAIAWARALTGASAESVYRTASLAFDLGIPQVVNGLKTARVAMPKAVIDSMRAAGVAEKEKEVLNDERRETKKAAKKSEEEL
jgi:acetamidase/formamidase